METIEVNPVGQTATVTFDPAEISLAGLRRCIVECGYQCAGQSVPGHVCDPMALPGEQAEPARATRSAEELMGHGGHAMSMDAMVRDMRPRGYNAIALPIAAGVFQPAFGLVLRPEIAALSMSGSSFIVAVNAVMLKRLRPLPASVSADHDETPAESAQTRA